MTACRPLLVAAALLLPLLPTGGADRRTRRSGSAT